LRGGLLYSTTQIAIPAPRLTILLAMEHPESSWLRSGTRQVLHELAKKNPDLFDVVGPVTTALEGFEPEIGCMEPAHAALDRLRGSVNNLLPV
jgi:hypothetical protein